MSAPEAEKENLLRRKMRTKSASSTTTTRVLTRETIMEHEEQKLAILEKLVSEIGEKQTVSIRMVEKFAAS
jgi:hypothetical protein